MCVCVCVFIVGQSSAEAYAPSIWTSWAHTQGADWWSTSTREHGAGQLCSYGKGLTYTLQTPSWACACFVSLPRSC